MNQYLNPKILGTALLLLILQLFSSQCSGQLWQPVGPDDHGVASFGASGFQRIVIDNAGTPYISFAEVYHFGNKLRVRKYNGTQWQDVGNGFVSDGGTGLSDLAINSSNTLYTVYIDSANGAGASVKMFDGVDWVYVGMPAFSAGFVKYPRIAISATNNVYVAYLDVVNNGITIKKFDGINWVTLGSVISGNQGLSIAIAANGDPYVSFVDVGNVISVKKYDGNNWVYVGAADIAGGYTSLSQLEFDNNGVPYIGYFISSNVFVKKFDGSNWVTVGSPTSVSFPAWSVTVKFDNSNVTYTCYTSESTGSVVKKFDGTTWQPVGSSFSDYSTNNDLWPALVLDNSNTPYTIVGCNEINSRTVVKRFDGTNWERLGPEGYDSIDELAMGTNDTPFIFSWADTAVRKFDGNNWVMIGNTNVDLGQSYHMAVDTANSNTPYIAYRNKYGDTGACVIKYDGTNWVVVGSLDFSVGKVSNIEIDIDGNGVPYVAYTDFTVGTRATVMKFDGVNWVNVGTPGFSLGSAGPHIVIDQNNVPYVCYSDASLGFGICVKKFDGSNWTDVGIPDLSSGPGRISQLAFDGSANPFVIYEDNIGGLNYKSTVKRFDGVNWVNVGNAEFSAGTIGWPDMVIHKSGTVYTIFRDNEANKARVMMFNGVNWVQLGDDVSGGFAELINLGCSNNVLVASFNSQSLLRSGFVRKFNITPAITQDPEDQHICTGGNTSFSILTTGVTGFQWQVDPGTGWVNVTNNATYSGATTNTLDITAAGIGMNGYQYRCAMSLDGNNITSNAATLSVSANIVPTLSISASPDDTVCAATLLTLVATSNISGTQPQYQWILNGVPINGATNNVYYINAVDGDIISCEITSGLSCISSPVVPSNDIVIYVPNGTSTPPDVAITANPGTTITQNTLVTFTSTCTNCINETYQWKLNGSNIPAANADNYSSSTLNNNDVISVFVQSSPPCATSDTATSNLLVMNVTAGVGHLNGNNANFRLYPNPVTGHFVIEGKRMYAHDIVAELKITNAIGQCVYSRSMRVINTDVKLNVELEQDLPNGIYFVELLIGEENFRARFMLGR